VPLQSRILFARTDINCAARLVGEMNERVSVLKRGFVPIRRSDQPMTTGTHATDNVIFFRDDDAIVSPAVLVKIGKIFTHALPAVRFAGLFEAVEPCTLNLQPFSAGG